MFKAIKQVNRIPQDVFLQRICQHQRLNAQNLSLVIVQNSDPTDPRGISFKVSREMGIKIARRLELSHTCYAAIKNRAGISVRPVIAVVVEPTYQLNYAMRWVYQIMLGGQFTADHAKEIEYVNQVGA